MFTTVNNTISCSTSITVDALASLDSDAYREILRDWHIKTCKHDHFDAGQWTYGSQGTANNWYLYAQTATVTANQYYYNPAWNTNLYATWNQVLIGGSITYPNVVITESEEEKALRQVQEKARELAKIRAEELLVTLLNNNQRESWAKEKRFDVLVRGKLYRLRPYDRVQLIEKDKPTLAYCIHPSFEHDLPAEDVLLAQKLMLETNEAEFLRIANATRVA